MKLLNDRENEYPLFRQKNIIKRKIFSVLTLITLSLGMATGTSKKASLIELAQQSKPVERDWEYTSFSAEGLDPTRFELLKERIQDNTFRKVDGVVVVKRGKILIEEYFNGYDRDKLHEIRSATKSIGSALLSIAIDQDFITGVQDKLYTYFRERQSFLNWDERKDKITLENVLNMTTGLDCNDMDSSSEGNESNVIQATEIVQFMLDLPVVYEPGEHWAYSTGSAHLIGAVIESAAGISIQEFAKIYLFEPLDITRYTWRTTGGIAHTGGGFWMRPIDMAKFGQLYLTRGRWQGKQIISEEWTDEASMAEAHKGAYRHPKYKMSYRVNNWSKYEKSLQNRGDITVWLSQDAINSWMPPKNGKRGGQPIYSDISIETSLILRLVFHLSLRQAEGFLRSILKLMDLYLPAQITRQYPAIIEWETSADALGACRTALCALSRQHRIKDLQPGRMAL